MNEKSGQFVPGLKPEYRSDDSGKRPLPPWGSYERSMQFPWPVTPDEQIAHAAYWRQKEAPAIARRKAIEKQRYRD